MIGTTPEPDELEELGTFLVEMRAETLARKADRMRQWIGIGRAECALALDLPGARWPRHIHILRSFKAERFRMSSFALEAALKPLIAALKSENVADSRATFSMDQIKQTDGEDWIEVAVFAYKEPPYVGPRAA